VHVTTDQILAAAEQTIPNFYKEFVLAGFRFNVFADQAARRLAEVTPAHMVRRLRARTTTVNHPPAPIVVMLGEIVVHGEDIRRPLGLSYTVDEAALVAVAVAVAVADNYVKTNLLIGSERRIADLRLVATDVAWAHEDGPEVTGPLTSLIMAMSGRTDAVDDLGAEGVALLAARS
jgi:uncharacterized protein (TIGR03083 family)